jgi:hypothetical protein
MNRKDLAESAQARADVVHTDKAKLVFEHTKHLTTLSAGSILALVALYEKLASRHWRALIIVSLVSLVISILGGLRAQMGAIDRLDFEHPRDAVAAGSYAVSAFSFALAMVALGVYGARNFF